MSYTNQVFNLNDKNNTALFISRRVTYKCFVTSPGISLGIVISSKHTRECCDMYYIGLVVLCQAEQRAQGI